MIKEKTILKLFRRIKKIETEIITTKEILSDMLKEVRK